MVNASSAPHQFNDPLRQAIIGSELPKKRDRQAIATGALALAFVATLLLMIWFRGEVAFYAHFYFELLMSLCT